MHGNIILLVIIVIGLLSFNLNASDGEQVNQIDDSEYINRGKAIYKKSNCAFCHGWSGDGQGHPRSPGVAANLRATVLDRETISYVIRCGVVGGVMPYHDRMAYRDDRCVANPSDLEPGLLPQKGTNIHSNDLAALVSYIITNMQGKGKASFEECEAYFKTGSRNCLYLK